MNITPSPSDSGWIKLDLLSHGIFIPDATHTFLRGTSGVAFRRKFYNDPIWAGSSSTIPQELRVGGTVVGLNCYGESPWELGWDQGRNSVVLFHRSGAKYAAELIADLELFRSNAHASRVANLYGGAALAFFSPRTCYFFSEIPSAAFALLPAQPRKTDHFKDCSSPKTCRQRSDRYWKVILGELNK